MFYIQYTYKIMNTNVYNDYSFIAKLESTWLFGISELFSCTVLILYWQNLPWNWSVQRQTGSPIRVPLLEYTHSSSPPFMHLIKNIKFINFFAKQIQCYLRRIRIQRRLYEIHTVCFFTFMIPPRRME